MKPLRLIELFAGYGSQAMALKRAEIPFEHYRVVEFDKYAIRAYNAVHGTEFPAIDIRDIKGEDLGIVDTEIYDYLLFYSFPCTDLSISGERKGMSRDANTRSGLLWEVERLLNECENLPQILVMENVTQVHSKQNIKDFSEWINFLDSKGYYSKWQDMNASDYGVPQCRNRTFMVSLLDDRAFSFPAPIELDRCLRDILESKVDEKYYLSEKMINYICVEQKGNFHYTPEIDLQIARPLTASMHKMHRASTDNYVSDSFVYGGTKTNIEPICLNSIVDGKQPSLADRVYDSEAVATAITTGYLPSYTHDNRIRKLTPLESFRLMGVTDEDALKIIAINSDTRCYQLAGNSIVVDVLVAIFKRLFMPDQGASIEPYQMDIFEYIRQENITNE